ncbi:hypothetical protein B0H13DRAFT_916750 [Mycena leptocephala]|nr:hypothetical protein B0H13DRAFT_916750 [Mycena leptocephala]
MPNLAVELDSVLAKWFSSIPDHLIWPSDRPDTLFFEQSAVLQCLYYYTRMLIHRPFIPGVSSMVQSDPQALGICAAAARACILVADTHRRRPNNPLLFSQSPVFTAAMILIMNEWSNPPSPRNPGTISRLSSQLSTFSKLRRSAGRRQGCLSLCLSGSFPLIQTRRSNSPTIRTS